MCITALLLLSPAVRAVLLAVPCYVVQPLPSILFLASLLPSLAYTDEVVLGAHTKMRVIYAHSGFFHSSVYVSADLRLNMGVVLRTIFNHFVVFCEFDRRME